MHFVELTGLALLGCTLLYRFIPKVRTAMRYTFMRLWAKLTRQRSIHSLAWFGDGAAQYKPGMPLHHASQWRYYSEEQWIHFVDAVLSHAQPSIELGMKIFEVGVGVGAFSKTMLDRYGSLDVSGADPVPSTIAIAQRAIPSGKFYVLNGLNLVGIASNAYDCVIANGVILYLNNLEEATQFMREMTRIAKPGAALIVTLIVEPGSSNIGSGNLYFPKSWWHTFSDTLQITSFQTMGQWVGFSGQDDRYAVYLQKK